MLLDQYLASETFDLISICLTPLAIYFRTAAGHIR